MQLTLDSLTKERFVIDKPVRLIELFCGIGSQAKALQRLGVEFEHHIAWDIDKFAIISYNAIHGTDFEPVDITKAAGSDLGIADTGNYCYILTYSFPCQDLSNAGKRQGMEKGSSTRSGLIWEVGRLLTEAPALPQVLLMENVTQVHGKANLDSFRDWIMFLESLGYTSTYTDLNAKDFGILQDRDRTFMISLLGNYYYEFPKPIQLTETMNDRLEDNVDEKYYLSEKQVQSLNTNTFGAQQSRINEGGGGYAIPCVQSQKQRPVSKSIRVGGRGDVGRHEWDLVYE